MTQGTVPAPPIYGDKDVLAAHGFLHYEDQNAAEKSCRSCQFFSSHEKGYFEYSGRGAINY
jgi:hypothetical protein